MDDTKARKKKVINENILTTKSNLKGLAGFFEFLLRRFRNGTFLAALLPLYLVGILAMGISAAPGLAVFFWVKDATMFWPPIFHYIALGSATIAAYFIYGLCLIFVVPFFNFILPFRIKPFRGNYFSLGVVPWYIHNALTYIVRYTFLEFITPTPLNTLFYRLMGMKMGKGVHINTTNISDPGLIEIGDYVTIGGSAHLIAHYGQKGYLVLSKVKIGNGVTIGMKATIMGAVEIGDGAMIGPHEVVLPKTKVPPHRRPPKTKGIISNEPQKSQQNETVAESA